MNALSRSEYTINMMYREQLFLIQKQILSVQKNRFNYGEIQTLKSIMNAKNNLCRIQ